MPRQAPSRARTAKSLERREATRTKEITLNKLLWEIAEKYDVAIRQLREEKEKMMYEAVEKFCPLPKKGEHILADYTFRGKIFCYEDFKPNYGDVVIYGGVVKSNGNVSELQKAESRIDGKAIKIIVPCEDE